MFGGLGTTELILILALAFLIFGGKKLPELGSSIGKGIKNFKKGLSGVTDDEENKAEPPQIEERKKIAGKK